MIKYKNIKNNQDLPAQAGQVMLLAVLIIGTSMLAMTSISGYLILQRIRSSSNIVDSTKAIFAADTGIEWEFLSVPNAIRILSAILLAQLLILKNH